MVNLDDLRRRIERGAEERVRLSAPIVQRSLQDAAPVAADGGGRMRDSITATATGLRLEVRVAVDYATFTIEDTQPHVIRGNPILAFKWPKAGSGTFFFRKVNHPGTSGTIDWYTPKIERWPDILERVA